MRYEIGDTIKETYPMGSKEGEIIAINLLHGDLIEYAIKSKKYGCLEMIKDYNFDETELIKKRENVDKIAHFSKKEEESSIIIKLQNGVELVCAEYMHKDVPYSEFEETMYKDITINQDTIEKISIREDNYVIYQKKYYEDFTNNDNKFYVIKSGGYYYGMDKTWQTELGRANLYKTTKGAIKFFNPRDGKFSNIKLCEITIETKELKALSHRDFIKMDNKKYKGEL
jgi:hypothetical protein